MLIINAIFVCKEGKREELIKKVKEEGIDTASRGEEGNLKYDWFVSAENDVEILLYEFWKDQDAHALHRTLPHYLRLEELKKEYVADTSVKKYLSDQEV